MYMGSGVSLGAKEETAGGQLNLREGFRTGLSLISSREMHFNFLFFSVNMFI